MRIVFFLMFLSSAVFSQEIVNTLIHNTQLSAPSVKLFEKRSANVLVLPFFDDFSTYKGYPNPQLWDDHDAYINTNLPLEPVNIGVATLDGLDSLGNPRNISSANAFGDADYLTSKTIDLSSFSEVYLSFYFQPEGVGNAPEPNDVLSLEVKDLSGVWLTIWDTLGFGVAPFQKMILTLDNTSYMHADFQFRFHNKATLSGNFDHWHIDNVLLTEDYSLIEDEDDVAFIHDDVRLLETYYEMPWLHFQNSGVSYINFTESILSSIDPVTFDSTYLQINDYLVNVIIRNNYASIEGVNYKYILTKPSGSSIVYPANSIGNPGRNDDIHPFESDGLFDYALHANASGGGVEVLDPTLFFTESLNNPSFEFKQILTTNDADHFKDNDTLYFTQKFNNLYALDDGSAEASYGVNVSGGKVAMRFNLAQADSLKALQLHFQQNLNDVSATAFQIVVWENDGGVPGDTIHVFPTLFYPEYTNQHNGFFEYELESALFLSGSFFIGWQQFYPDILNIGLDKNTNNNDRMYYNIGSLWEQSSCAGCEGTWMMRPVFGSLSSTEQIEITTLDFELFPNPTNASIHIKYPTIFSIKIYDMNAAPLLAENDIHKSWSFNTKLLKPGMYIVELQSGQVIKRKKLIVQ